MITHVEIVLIGIAINEPLDVFFEDCLITLPNPTKKDRFRKQPRPAENRNVTQVTFADNFRSLEKVNQMHLREMKRTHSEYPDLLWND